MTKRRSSNKATIRLCPTGAQTLRAAIKDKGQGHVSPVASPAFAARRGKAGNYVMGHSRWTSGPGAAAAWWL